MPRGCPGESVADGRLVVSLVSGLTVLEQFHWRTVPDFYLHELTVKPEPTAGGTGRSAGDTGTAETASCECFPR